MSFDGIERQFFAGANGQRQPPVVVGIVGGSQQGGCGWGDGDGSGAGRHPPESDGALLADFGVRGQPLPGQDVERGEQGGASRLQAARIQQIEKRAGEFGQHFRALVSIGDHDQRPLGDLPQQDRIQGLGGRRQTGQRKRPRLVPQKGGNRMSGTPPAGRGSEIGRGRRDGSRAVPIVLVWTIEP